MERQWFLLYLAQITDRLNSLQRFRKQQVPLPYKRVKDVYGDSAALRWWLARRMRGQR